VLSTIEIPRKHVHRRPPTTMADNEYPFLAELLNWDDRSHRCLGTLIASDMILTAAHCLYDANVLVRLPAGGNTTNTVRLFVVQAVWTHPSYYYNTYTGGIDVDPYDVAILQLCGRATLGAANTTAAGGSTTAFSGLNRNSTVLTLDKMQQDEEHSHQQLVGLGWDENGGAGVEITHLTYIPNGECILVNGTTGDGLDVSFASQIVDVSLCAAYEQGPGLCPGDSGGPIFLSDNLTSPFARLELGQVGITSSSYGCRDKALPTLNVRVSKVSDWVDSVVCNASVYHVPLDFGCQGSNPTENGDDDVKRPMAELTVQLELGAHPKNIGWILYQVVVENGSRRLYATMEHPIQSYIASPPNATVNETLKVPIDSAYEILLMDISQESFRDATALRVWSNGESVGVWDVNVTMGKTAYQFTLGSQLTSAPSTLNPTQQPTQPKDSRYLTVFIALDAYPTETGFLVEDLDGTVDDSESLPLLYVCYPGTFSSDMAQMEVQRTVPLPASVTSIRFTMTDNEHDGLEPPAFYELWLGPRSNGTLLAEGGVFYLEDRHQISIPEVQSFRNTQVPSFSPSVVAEASTSFGSCPGHSIEMQFFAVFILMSLVRYKL
jgi:Trypsin